MRPKMVFLRFIDEYEVCERLWRHIEFFIIIKSFKSHVNSKIMVTNPEPVMHLFCKVAKMNNKVPNTNGTKWPSTKTPKRLNL